MIDSPDVRGQSEISFSASGSSRSKRSKPSRVQDTSGKHHSFLKRSRRRASGTRRRSHRSGFRSDNSGAVKIFAAIVAVCALVAFIAGILFGTDYGSVANYFLFGNTAPQISAKRQKGLENEFKKMIKKHITGSIP